MIRTLRVYADERIPVECSLDCPGLPPFLNDVGSDGVVYLQALHPEEQPGCEIVGVYQLDLLAQVDPEGGYHGQRSDGSLEMSDIHDRNRVRLSPELVQLVVAWAKAGGSEEQRGPRERLSSLAG